MTRFRIRNNGPGAIHVFTKACKIEIFPGTTRVVTNAVSIKHADKHADYVCEALETISVVSAPIDLAAKRERRRRFGEAHDS